MAQQQPERFFPDTARELKGIFQGFAKARNATEGLKIQEQFNKTMTKVFQEAHQGDQTGNLEQPCCTCGGEDDTEGLNSTYSLKDFLLDVDFKGEGTAGLQEGPTEQFKQNQLEFERQERLLKDFDKALTLTAPLLSTNSQ